MESEDRFNKMSYEELADFAVLHGLNVPYTAILELIGRGPYKADYLLRFIKDRSYWVSDSFNFKVIPVISIGILAGVKRRDLWDEIFPYLSVSYDFAWNVLGEFALSVLSDLLPLDISKIKNVIDNDNLMKFLSSDIIEAYGIMASRKIISRSSLLDFLRDEIQNNQDKSIVSICIWVSLDAGAIELRPFIDRAFQEGRVDLDTITPNDIKFLPDFSGVPPYHNPVEFFQPSNLEDVDDSVNEEMDASEIIYSIYHDVGVNEKCPCNSGKKFKKCCKPLLVEREKWMDLEEKVWKHLENCKYGNDFSDYIKDAYKIFSSKVSADIRPDNDIFLSWAIHDYIIPEKKRSILSLYIQLNSSSIKEDEREILNGLIRSNFVVVEVEKVVPYIGYHVVEMFPGGERYFVTDTLSTKQVSNHSLLLFRLYRIRTVNRIGGGIMKIPYHDIDVVKDLSMAIMKEYSSMTGMEERNKNTLSNFIAAHSLQLISALYDRSRRQLFPQLVSPEGDPIIFNSSTYRIDNRSKVMEKLTMDQRFTFDDLSGDIFIWNGPLENAKAHQPETDLGERVYGTVKLKDDSITVECFTANRWRQCVSILRSILGDNMGTEILKTETSISDRLRDAAKNSTEKSVDDLPSLAKIKQKLIDNYYMKWIDDKIPALGNKTPREASKDPELRKELISLLNEIESSSDPSGKVPRPPIEKMKKELHLL